MDILISKNRRVPNKTNRVDKGWDLDGNSLRRWFLEKKQRGYYIYTAVGELHEERGEGYKMYVDSNGKTLKMRIWRLVVPSLFLYLVISITKFKRVIKFFVDISYSIC